MLRDGKWHKINAFVPLKYADAQRALKQSFGMSVSVKVNFFFLFKEEACTLGGSGVIGSNKNNTH